MLKFGFSYIGAIVLVIIAIPNIIWTKAMPVDYKEKTIEEKKLFQIPEQLGRVIIAISALIFKDFNIEEPSLWLIWLGLSGVMMLCYYVDWVRYFKSERHMRDMYDKFGLSLFPILAFLFLGIYGVNIVLISGVLLLAFGHIGIHFQYMKALDIKWKKSN